MKFPVFRTKGESGQDMIVHPLMKSARIIINYPGRESHIDGFNNKYRSLARLMVERGLGTVIQMENRDRAGVPYAEGIVRDLMEVIAYALSHVDTLCGRAETELCLMGASAGASAIAAVSGHNPAIKKILLLEPSANATGEAMQRGLRYYEGELYIVTGSVGNAIGEEFGRRCLSWAKQVAHKELVVLPECDHQFKGTRNGMIFSKAPFWAFAGDKTFPSPEGGLVLY